MTWGHWRSSILARLAIASLTGACFALAAPPGGHLWLAWLGATPLLVLVRHTGTTWREALVMGLVAGLGVGLGGFPWIAGMLEQFTGVPGAVSVIGLFLFSLWMALPYGLWAVAIQCGPRKGWQGRVWVVGTIVVLNFTWPNLFPYTVLLGFAEQPEWIQLVEWGGIPLLESLVCLCSLLLADAIAAGEHRERTRLALTAAMIPLLVFLYGGWRMRTMDAEADGAPTLRVGVVQLNVPIGGGHSARADVERLQASWAKAQDAGAQLVIWPEAGAYPYLVERPLGPDNPHLESLVRGQHALPTVFGARTRATNSLFGYNTAILMAPSGQILDHYDKHYLVPIGEYIPIINPTLLTNYIPEIAHHFAGVGPARFLFETSVKPGQPAMQVALGPVICYEDIIASYVREVAAQPDGIDLLVNLTIDAWYGDSAEPWEHLALAQFRSVEHRIPMVRSVITGVSAVIDHNGRLQALIPLRPVARSTLDDYPTEILVETIALPRNTAETPTPFARFGWWLPYGWMGILLGLWLRAATPTSSTRSS
jgi:apolipoprotein N-acyltransferase